MGPEGTMPLSLSYSLLDAAPDVVTKGGEARIVDSTKFPVSTAIAAAHVRVHKGGLRELHWHPNADEWLYVISGRARITLFAAVGRARTMDFDAGDVGYIPQAMGHFVENVGDTDLCFLEIFKTNRYASISLSSWMSHTPVELVAAHTNMALDDLKKIAKRQVVIMPQ